MTKHIKLFEQFINEGLSKSEISQIENYLDKYVDEDALFDMCNDFYADDSEWHDVKNDLDKADLMKWAISCFKTNGFKLKDVKTIFEQTVTEGTYNSSKEVAIYDGGEGLTHIEKRGSGYYGYNDEFDFEAKDKKELEQMLKKWGYKLVSGSL
jgi:hypothetical protein